MHHCDLGCNLQSLYAEMRLGNCEQTCEQMACSEAVIQLAIKEQSSIPSMELIVQQEDGIADPEWLMCEIATFDNMSSVHSCRMQVAHVKAPMYNMLAARGKL